MFGLPTSSTNDRLQTWPKRKQLFVYCSLFLLTTKKKKSWSNANRKLKCLLISRCPKWWQKLKMLTVPTCWPTIVGRGVGQPVEMICARLKSRKSQLLCWRNAENQTVATHQFCSNWWNVADIFNVGQHFFVNYMLFVRKISFANRTNMFASIYLRRFWSTCWHGPRPTLTERHRGNSVARDMSPSLARP